MQNNYPKWVKPNGEVISCIEKLKVMQENLDELQQLSQDLFEDAILMEIDSNQIQQYLINMMQKLHNPYKSFHV